MLKALRIENFALVDRLEIEFGSGLNILTGATGAGKSVIVGAINLVLGERASPEMVRTGTAVASIEGTFKTNTDNPIFNMLKELGIATSTNTLDIRREISSKGISRCFINNRLLTLANLKSIGDKLGDLHGQHQHQALLDSNKHIDYLDSFGNLKEEVDSIAETFKSLRIRSEELRRLKEQERADGERKELYCFQLNEINRANLVLDEEGKLLQQKKVLENAEELFRLVSSISAGLYEEDDSAAEKLSFYLDELKKATELDLRLREELGNLESALVQVEEISRSLTKYKDSIEFDADKLEGIRERVDLLNSLKKKYGKNIQEIFDYAKRIDQELKNMTNRSEEIREKEEEVKGLAQKLKGESIALSCKRKKETIELATKIQKELSFLGMEKTKFETRVESSLDEDGLLEIDGKRYYVDEKGMDRVEFFVSPNPGEELKPLAKIASGGEISRIMLALKVILSKMDDIDALVFDEIDVGIGGEVAQAVGKKLKDLASSCQVICITHLQQIVSQAEHHFKVFKEMSDKRMVTRIKRLNAQEKVEEIARLISGKKITPMALKQAAEMIKEGKGD
jgi:DNA repair protein RecN (Recombination protein N)